MRMKNLLKRMLTGHKGESIAESLVSILIVALASIIFAGMVTGARSIIDKSSNWMQDYYQAVSAINAKMEDTDAGVAVGEAEVNIGGVGQKEDVITYSYKVGDVEIISYVPKPSASPAPSGG